MPLIGLAIAAACQNTYANHQDACTHFLEASTKQTQIYQYDEKAENYFTTEATNFTVSNFGTETVDVVGSTVFVYKIYKNKSVNFRLPTMGICDKASNSITENSYSLNLSWKMPWLK